MPVDAAPPPLEAPVTDTAQPPPPQPPRPPLEAPVTDPIQDTDLTEAPVTDVDRIQVGSLLARRLLCIVAGSIVIFVLYLIALDWVTSNEVTQVYHETFQQMRDIAIPHDASGADDAAKILQRASRVPATQVSVVEAAKVRSVVEQLEKSGRLNGPNATQLDQCVQFILKPPAAINESAVKQATAAKKDAKGQKNTASQGSPAATLQPSPTATPEPSPTISPPPSSPATAEPSPAPASLPSPVPSPAHTAQASPTPGAEPQPVTTLQPSPGVTASPALSDGARDQGTPPSDATDRATAFEQCVNILDPLRQISASQAIDLDRLRLMKEYAHDAHEHRQAFRSFWLQAAQLVLLNLLLPVLTALLGYIFGSREH